MNEEFRRTLGIETPSRVTGGCIHECYQVLIGKKDLFLKCNAAGFDDAFAAEADGLAGLREAGYRAPEPRSHGVAAGRSYLLMEFLDLKGAVDFPALGRMLAAAHRKTGPRFGWHRDNYIGATPQANGWCDDWAEFWRERRMQPQLELAKQEWFFDRLGNRSLICWKATNRNHRCCTATCGAATWASSPDGPVVFDPAVYYGDREADLAMTELFGGFPREFYRCLRRGVSAGRRISRQRKHLYNLYHLLNHLNLFGRSYLGQVEETLGLLLRL